MAFPRKLTLELALDSSPTPGTGREVRLVHGRGTCMALPEESTHIQQQMKDRESGPRALRQPEIGQLCGQHWKSLQGELTSRFPVICSHSGFVCRGWVLFPCVRSPEPQSSQGSGRGGHPLQTILSVVGKAKCNLLVQNKKNNSSVGPT